MKKLSRRDFLKALGFGTEKISLLNAAEVPAGSKLPSVKIGTIKIKYAEETLSETGITSPDTAGKHREDGDS
ncbi:MAG: hypothetical protein H0Z39_00545 [Peptococcaceae bacterium]|nr:hypothetical protein [Peptococcaceae bacterium]